MGKNKSADCADDADAFDNLIGELGTRWSNAAFGVALVLILIPLIALTKRPPEGKTAQPMGH